MNLVSIGISHGRRYLLAQLMHLRDDSFDIFRKSQIGIPMSFTVLCPARITACEVIILTANHDTG